MLPMNNLYYEKMLVAAKKRREKVAKMHASGMKYREIGEKFGVTPQRIAQMIKQYKAAA